MCIGSYGFNGAVLLISLRSHKSVSIIVSNTLRDFVLKGFVNLCNGTSIDK